MRKGEYEKSNADFKKVLEVDPNNSWALSCLAWIYATCPDAKFRDGKTALQNAIKAYQSGRNYDCRVLFSLAAAYAECGDFAQAGEWQEKAIEVEPQDGENGDKVLQARLELFKQGKPYHMPTVLAGPRSQEVVDWVIRGDTSDKKGEHDAAVADYTKALEINPKCLAAYTNRGTAWFEKGEFKKAIADYNEGLTLDPTDYKVCFWRGVARRNSGDYGGAIDDYGKVLAIDSEDPTACGALAWLYATCPDAKYRDGKKAVEYANKAHELIGDKTDYCLDTLAAAYAESEDFAKARGFEETAIEVAVEKEKPELRRRLELYKQGKPYRMDPVKK